MSYSPTKQPGYALVQQHDGQPQPGANSQPLGYPPPAAGYGGQQPPIVHQPTAGGQERAPVSSDGWMVIPQQVPVNCPPGLQYLTTIDHLLIKQKVELLEAFIGFESNNKYTIKNKLGQNVYYAVEETDCFARQCCGPNRPFEIKIVDNYKNEVISLIRELSCNSCLPCCLQKLSVSSPPGNFIGSVEQLWSICVPQFDIKDASGQTILKIEGGSCQCALCSDVEFPVYSADKSAVVGKISKVWSGLAREAFTDSDNFGITFPLDLDVRMKAVMIGACFLIDFMYFETSN